MEGCCVDTRRYLIVEDYLAGQVVHDAPRPLVDAIPAPSGDWWDNAALRALADGWARLNRVRVRVAQ